jgi:hypothetical protein
MSMKNYSKQILKKIKLNTIQAIVLTLSRESTRQIVAVVHIDDVQEYPQQQPTLH